MDDTREGVFVGLFIGMFAAIPLLVVAFVLGPPPQWGNEGRAQVLECREERGTDADGDTTYDKVCYGSFVPADPDKAVEKRRKMGGMPRKPGAEFEAYMVGGKIYPWTASTGRWWTYLAWWVIPLAFPVSVALFNRFGVRNKGLEIGGYGVAGLYVLVSGILWLVL